MSFLGANRRTTPSTSRFPPPTASRSAAATSQRRCRRVRASSSSVSSSAPTAGPRATPPPVGCLAVLCLDAAEPPEPLRSSPCHSLHGLDEEDARELLLRIVGVLVAITVGAGIVAFLFTRDRRYLRLSWQVAKYSALFALLVLGLMFLERVIVL